MVELVRIGSFMKTLKKRKKNYPLKVRLIQFDESFEAHNENSLMPFKILAFHNFIEKKKTNRKAHLVSSISLVENA